MRNLLLLFVIIISACENHSFESDKRQLIAKDEIRSQLRKAHSFNITGFRQDTLQSYTDTTIKHPISYGLDFVYTDSTGVVQKKKAIVVFTPNGTSVLHSQISDQN